jgi:hypothetical protein
MMKETVKNSNQDLTLHGQCIMSMRNVIGIASDLAGYGSIIMESKYKVDQMDHNSLNLRLIQHHGMLFMHMLLG